MPVSFKTRFDVKAFDCIVNGEEKKIALIKFCKRNDLCYKCAKAGKTSDLDYRGIWCKDHNKQMEESHIKRLSEN